MFIMEAKMKFSGPHPIRSFFHPFCLGLIDSKLDFKVSILVFVVASSVVVVAILDKPGIFCQNSLFLVVKKTTEKIVSEHKAKIDNF